MDKKNSRLLVYMAGIFGIALLLGACAKPPTAEMEQAVAAVTRAENNADAVTYGSTSLIRAREALSRMQSEAASKRYDGAKNFAADAVAAAERAISDGQAGAARERQDAANLINSLRAPMEETGNAINAAKRVENITLDFENIDQDFAAAQRTAGEAQVSLGNNNYPDVTAKCQTVRSTLSSINIRLADAAQAVSRKK